MMIVVSLYFVARPVAILFKIEPENLFSFLSKASGHGETLVSASMSMRLQHVRNASLKRAGYILKLFYALSASCSVSLHQDLSSL